MKIIITVKTGKGLKSTKKEIDKTVDVVLSIGKLISEKFKEVRGGSCKIHADGTSLILN